MKRGVILYGPPAAGKDTIDAALCDLDSEYRHFNRLKVGPGRTSGYRTTTPDELDALRADGEVIWENERYGATYAVDRRGLTAALQVCSPILHLGQPEAVRAVLDAVPEARWTVAALWCPRPVAARRLMQRGNVDVAERLAVWDATPALPTADLQIDTSITEPDIAALGTILQRALSSCCSMSFASTWAFVFRLTPKQTWLPVHPAMSMPLRTPCWWPKKWTRC